MSLRTLFVALVPDETICSAVHDYKSRLNEALGDQLYLKHPPHSTLYQAVFSDPQTVIAALKAVAEQSSAVPANVIGWTAFLNDPLTGKHTLVCDLASQDLPRLREMQRRVIQVLAPLRDRTATAARLDSRWQTLNETQRQCVQERGFPYIGAGWHPHFTIASVQPDAWSWVQEHLLGNAPALLGACPHLNVYELVGQDVKLLHSFSLPSGHFHAPLRRDSEPQRISSRNVQEKTTFVSPSVLPSETLKQQIQQSLWRVADECPWICSATLTGSFVEAEGLDGISDIDFVVITDRPDVTKWDTLLRHVDRMLRPVVESAGLRLMVNPTLGPLKFNDENTAVLHLMLYSRSAHVEHVIKSPFTCLDWQRTKHYQPQSLADIYPVFSLQPRHFVGARRSVSDYLRDYRRRVVSYRELEFHHGGYQEVPREKPMSVRDEHEFAFHIVKFLMRNLAKLVLRENRAPDELTLQDYYFGWFPKNEATTRRLFRELSRRKRSQDFSQPIDQLAARLESFVADFESQFRHIFLDEATRHIFFRHARTPANRGRGDQAVFLGRSNPSIDPLTPHDCRPLLESIQHASPLQVFSSPLKRCRESLAVLRSQVSLPSELLCEALLEMNYGRCEGLQVGEARREFLQLFADWKSGRDPAFPEGERTADVFARLDTFLSTRLAGQPASLVCTHNVPLRCLVGSLLNVPSHLWYRLQIPHLAPVALIETRLGWFVELDESVERQIFADFAVEPASTNHVTLPPTSEIRTPTTRVA